MSARFEELRELCMEAGDKASMATAMVGMTVENVLHGHVGEAARLASEYMAVIESIGDPTLTIGLTFAAIVAKHQIGEVGEALRWTQMVIDLADGDPIKGGFILGSPLSAMLVWRGMARWIVGQSGWREDFDRACAYARESDPLSLATVVTYKYVGISRGVLLADDAALREIEAALELAERSSDDMALVLLRMTFGAALVHNGTDRKRGFDIIRELLATCIEQTFGLNIVPLLRAYVAMEVAEQGQTDRAVEELRSIADEMLRIGNLGDVDLVCQTLAETLMARGTDGDLEEAHAVIDRFSSVYNDVRSASREIIVLRLRALLARARRDESSYRDLRDRYRAMANDLGFEGHMAWAAAMP
jgi:hypothetical protein